MNERIIRLQPKGKPRKIELLDIEKDTNLFVDVHRENYNDDLKGFFVRYPHGVTVVVNNNLSPREQAYVIKRLVHSAKLCVDSVVGMINGNNQYRCECDFCFNLEV